MTPNEIQIGGDHYKKAGDRQHWDMLPACGFGWEYYIGIATKYLTRIKDKELDPAKALHVVDKLMWLIDNGLVPSVFQTTKGNRLHADGGTLPQSQRVDVEGYLVLYYKANGIDPESTEAKVIYGLMLARTRDDLEAVRDLLASWAAPAKKAEPKQAVPTEVAAQLATGGEVVGEKKLVGEQPSEATVTTGATAAYTNQDGGARRGGSRGRK